MGNSWLQPSEKSGTLMESDLPCLISLSRSKTLKWSSGSTSSRSLVPIGEPTRFSPPPLSLSRAIRW